MSSSPSSAASGHSAFPWILEHILAYPGTYEIPLRTMYTLNSAPQTQPLPHHSARPHTPSLTHSTASSPKIRPESPEIPPGAQHRLPVQNATDHFKSCLMTHISQLPSQPFSLPPAFITSFVRRCFTTDLCSVDFTQALTALDYLKDLDNRRKRELSLALQRLGFDKNSVTDSGAESGQFQTRVVEWVHGMQDKERKVEALYTQVYLGLRRWTLINEMRLEPFNKANSIAMLNTLYPPTAASPPTQQLTFSILDAQRKAFFRYIQAVEKNGKTILGNLEAQGKGANEANGWPAVRESVDRYLQTANRVIEECLEINGPESLDPNSANYRRNDRRADSGVSFGIERPSTSSSRGSRSSSMVNKPLPASPALVQGPLGCSSVPPSPKKRGTTLEKIAREIRNLRSRSDPKGTVGMEDQEKVRTIKKMKSSSSIGANKNKHTRTGSDGFRDHTLEINDANRERLILEAIRHKEGRNPTRSSTLQR